MQRHAWLAFGLILGGCVPAQPGFEQIAAPAPTPVVVQVEPGVNARLLEDRIVIEGEKP